MLIGRDDEAGAVRRSLDAGRPVLVVGEAGAGKTTLLRTVADGSGRRVLEGGALATLSWLEHLPLTRALGHELTGRDREAVTAEVLRAVGDDGLLLLEDLHWAPPATLAVVADLAGRIPLLASVRSGAEGSDRALAALDGLDRMTLAPLAHDAAADLARRVRPRLSEHELADVVRRAGGNPLLLRELATDEASPSLRRTVAVRLRRLGAAEQHAFALLALAERPLAAGLLDPEMVAALASAGLVRRERDEIAVQHALLGEAAVEALEAEERAALHRELSDLLPDPAEAAHHLARAGDRARSRELALRAAATATRPGERAGLLRLAALSAEGADADELRLAAAESLAMAGDFDGVFTVLDQVGDTAPDVVARTALLRARAAWSGGRADDLQPALDAGLAVAAEAGVPLETLLRIEACRVPIFLEGDLDDGVRQAREALALATRTGVGRARAEYFLGTALLVMSAPEAPEHLRAAIDLARESGDTDTEMAAANNLVAFQESCGSPAEGALLAQALAERAEALGLGYWRGTFGIASLQLGFHAGQYAGLVEATADLLRQPLDPLNRGRLLEVHCLALVDSGRAVEAVRVAQDALAERPAHDSERPHFWWALAEAELWSDDPRRTLGHAEEFLAALPESNPNRVLGQVTRAWALFELGRDPRCDLDEPDRGFLAAVPHEMGALVAAHAGDLAGAVAGLRTAAGLWAAYHARGELRCAWAAGELLRRAGEIDEAVTSLTMVEKRAADIGLLTVAHRAARSLRAAGERRSARRTRGAAGLTGREQEVLALVGQGLTNSQIAARLGLTPRTVAAQTSSAAAKLGAANRKHAAALAAELD